MIFASARFTEICRGLGRYAPDTPPNSRDFRKVLVLLQSYKLPKNSPIVIVFNSGSRPLPSGLKRSKVARQNGHFQSRKHYSTRWHEQNCQVQCAGCNVFRYGEQYKFAKNLDNTFYDGLAEKLHIEANKTVKLDNTDLEMLIEKYQLLIKQLDV